MFSLLDIRKELIKFLPSWFSIDPKPVHYFSIKAKNIILNPKTLIIEGLIESIKDSSISLSEEKAQNKLYNYSFDRKTVRLSSLKKNISPDLIRIQESSHDNCILELITESKRDKNGWIDIYIYTNTNLALLDSFAEVLLNTFEYKFDLLKSLDPTKTTKEMELFWMILFGLKPSSKKSNIKIIEEYLDTILTSNYNTNSLYKALDQLFNPGKHQEEYSLVEAIKDQFIWRQTKKALTLNFTTTNPSNAELLGLEKILSKYVPLGSHVQLFIKYTGEGYVSSGNTKFGVNSGYGKNYGFIFGNPYVENMQEITELNDPESPNFWRRKYDPSYTEWSNASLTKPSWVIPEDDPAYRYKYRKP